MSNRLPNLFLIGAQKAGSTNLASHLEQAPEIAYFGKKEPNIFSRGSEEACRARLAEFSIPADAPEFLLDGSPDYTRAPFIPHVPEMIATIVGKDTPKFIYTMRHPVERTISHYFYSRQRYGETYGFEDALEHDKRYIDGSRYDFQIEKYLKIFPRESFYFVQFEDYISDPLNRLPALLDWVGASMPERFEPIPAFDSTTNKKETREALLPFVNRLARRQGIVRDVVKKVIPAGQHHRLANLMSKPAPRQDIPRGLKQKLLEQVFTESIDRTAELTGLDLSDWHKRYSLQQAKAENV